MGDSATMTAATVETPKAQTVDMKLEIVVIPVSDVDRAKAFYAGLGWRLDADFAAGETFRVVQFTPPGSARGLYLIVSDIAAARDALIARGVKVSDVFHAVAGAHTGADEPYILG